MDFLMILHAFILQDPFGMLHKQTLPAEKSFHHIIQIFSKLYLVHNLLKIKLSEVLMLKMEFPKLCDMIFS